MKIVVVEDMRIVLSAASLVAALSTNVADACAGLCRELAAKLEGEGTIEDGTAPAATVVTLGDDAARPSSSSAFAGSSHWMLIPLTSEPGSGRAKHF